MQGTIIIGEVLKPQGVRGEIKIKPYIDDFADIRNFKTLFIAGKEYKVLACRTDPSAAYLALSGIADRDAAELLRGKEVEALRSEAPAPAEGRYYIVDVIGCRVYTAEGKDLGEIADVTSAHTDIYELRAGDAGIFISRRRGRHRRDRRGAEKDRCGRKAAARGRIKQD